MDKVKEPEEGVLESSKRCPCSVQIASDTVTGSLHMTQGSQRYFIGLKNQRTLRLDGLSIWPSSMTGLMCLQAWQKENLGLPFSFHTEPSNHQRLRPESYLKDVLFYSHNSLQKSVTNALDRSELPLKPFNSFLILFPV